MSYVFREYRSRGKPWCIAYKGVDGRVRREKTDAPTKELAKKLLAKKMVEVTEAKVAGVTVQRKHVTFREFVKEYKSHIEVCKTPPSYQRDVDSIKHLLQVFADRRLTDINTGHVQKYVDGRLHEKKPNGKPFKPASINRELMCLSAIFREAVKRQLLDKNPVRGIKQLAEQNQVDRYLTDEEERVLLAACNPSLRPIVICALHSGMRRGEILSRTWEDVDFDQQLVRVRYTKSKKKRFIPINDTLDEMLRALPKFKECPYVFANPKTKARWSDKKIAWEYAVKKSGLKGLRFHDLRHTFASRLVQKGIPIKAVQELLGHASIVMTMRYAHLAPADLRRAVDLLVTTSDQGKPAATTGGLETTTQPATQSSSANRSKPGSAASPSAATENGEGDGDRTRNLRIDNPML